MWFRQLTTAGFVFALLTFVNACAVDLSTCLNDLSCRFGRVCEAGVCQWPMAGPVQTDTVVGQADTGSQRPTAEFCNGAPTFTQGVELVTAM